MQTGPECKFMLSAQTNATVHSLGYSVDLDPGRFEDWAVPHQPICFWVDCLTCPDSSLCEAPATFRKMRRKAPLDPTGPLPRNRRYDDQLELLDYGFPQLSVQNRRLTIPHNPQQEREVRSPCWKTPY